MGRRFGGSDADSLDTLFQQAVSAIDAGDVATLARLITDHPRLLGERLDAPGAWLRDQVGGALDGFFQRPYLLWFVAEDPVRNGKLPQNIASVVRAIIEAAEREGVQSLHEQIDYALTLVCWSWIARECAVQLELIDTLVDAGASLDGKPENALVNANFDAAAHLIERGATLSLATAACLERWDDVERLAPTAGADEKQFGFVLAALNGRAEALSRIMGFGVDVNGACQNLYSHGTPLHHAVSSGSLDAVRVLVEAGAELNNRDTVWKGTPLNWAEHYLGMLAADAERRERYAGIAAYLRDKGAAG